MFHVGQKVVCVDAVPDPGTTWAGEAPTRGAIYTVAAVGVSPRTLTLSLQIVELPRRRPEYQWYRARRFRPVQERKTDISIFTAMLKPKSVDA